MNTIPIKVNGSVLNDLSEKIPTYNIALNELLKNGYDAGATQIDIKLNTNEKTLTIIDNGSGMTYNDINLLFNIGLNKKKYGSINQYNRYTQGSKGLGFLSVFKFGDYATWKTKSNEETGYIFSINFKDIKESVNITDKSVSFEENNSLSKGTAIKIYLRTDEVNAILDILNEEKSYQKIIHTFFDTNNSIKINILINDMLCQDNNFSNLLNILPNYQLYNVKYNLHEQIIKFYSRNKLIHSIKFPFDFQNHSIDINLNLLIFRFPKKGMLKYIHGLFYNLDKMSPTLTPLIYINDNLFNNYNLFDTEITAHTSSSTTLRQMIGYIKIISDDIQMQFNSDRTNFTDNPFTSSIKRFLNEINKMIQTTGGKLKKDISELKNIPLTKKELDLSKIEDIDIEYFRQFIPADFKYKKAVSISKENNTVIFKLLDLENKIKLLGNTNIIKTNRINNEPEIVKKPNNSPSENTLSLFPQEKTNNSPELPPKVQEAKIILSSVKKTYYIPTEQIPLLKFIKDVFNSNGRLVNPNKLNITVNDTNCPSKILESVSVPCTKKIIYSYKDTFTGNVCKEIYISFKRRELKIISEPKNKSLITIPSNDQYKLDSFYTIGKLINQINSLSLDDYQELISCSLRSIFDIGITELRHSSKTKNLIKNNNNSDDSLIANVSTVFEYVLNNNAVLSNISRASGLEYKNLKNTLSLTKIKETLKLSHSGAHKSTTWLTNNDIIELGHLAGFYVVFIQELIYNNNMPEIKE